MNKQKGITLIALIITIIVMLILVGVSVNIALGNGLFKSAQNAAQGTETEKMKEKDLSSGKVTIEGMQYNSLEDYTQGRGGTMPEETYNTYMSVAPIDETKLSQPPYSRPGTVEITSTDASTIIKMPYGITSLSQYEYEVDLSGKQIIIPPTCTATNGYRFGTAKIITTPGATTWGDNISKEQFIYLRPFKI